MKNLTNVEIISIMKNYCINCHKANCFVHRLAQSSSQRSLSARLNMEKANQNAGIVETLGSCLVLDPKANGDLTL